MLPPLHGPKYCLWPWHIFHSQMTWPLISFLIQYPSLNSVVLFCIFHGIHGILERTCQKMSWNSVIQASFFYCIYRKYNIFPRFFFMKFLQTSMAFSSICCRTIEFSTNFSRFPTLDSADGGIVFRQKSDCKITFVFGHGKWWKLNFNFSQILHIHSKLNQKFY